MTRTTLLLAAACAALFFNQAPTFAQGTGIGVSVSGTVGSRRRYRRRRKRIDFGRGWRNGRQPRVGRRLRKRDPRKRELRCGERYEGDHRDPWQG